MVPVHSSSGASGFRAGGESLYCILEQQVRAGTHCLPNGARQWGTSHHQSRSGLRQWFARTEYLYPPHLAQAISDYHCILLQTTTVEAPPSRSPLGLTASSGIKHPDNIIYVVSPQWEADLDYRYVSLEYRLAQKIDICAPDHPSTSPDNHVSKALCDYMSTGSS